MVIRPSLERGHEAIVDCNCRAVTAHPDDAAPALPQAVSGQVAEGEPLRCDEHGIYERQRQPRHQRRQALGGHTEQPGGEDHAALPHGRPDRLRLDPGEMVHHVNTGVTGPDDENTPAAVLSDIAQVRRMDDPPCEAVSAWPGGRKGNAVPARRNDDVTGDLSAS